MDFKNCTIYLIGFQGVGKLSIAREICKQADFRLIDNHAINNLVFPMVRRDGKSSLPPEIWDVTKRLREIVLETLSTLGVRDLNFVFTNGLIQGQPRDLEVYNRVETAVREREGCFVPVRILCEEGEHRKRLRDPTREALWKQTDGTIVPRLHSTKQPLIPTHAHTLTLDVSALTPPEAAAVILEHSAHVYSLWSSPQDHRSR